MAARIARKAASFRFPRPAANLEGAAAGGKHPRRAPVKTSLSLLCLLLLAPSAFAAPSGGTDKPKTTADSAYNEGVAAMERGDFGVATTKFEEAIKLKADFAEAHNNLAFSLRKQGKDNFAAALKHYDKAIALNPKLAQAYHYRGVLQVLQGNEAAAKADHAKLLELDRELADELLKVIASKEEPAGYKGGAKKKP
jgi:Tfp pilus assembly protein PilF